MKVKNICIVMILSVGLVLFGCSSSEEPEIHEEPNISLSTEPATITVGDSVQIELSIEEHGMGGMSGLSLHGEMHLPDDTGLVDLDFHESTDHAGHYYSEYVFAIAGIYELHCSFMHEGENVEEVFTIDVQ